MGCQSICNDGEEWDDEAEECVSVCSDGEEWDDETGECVSTSVCGDDIEYNGQCIASKFQLTTTNTTDSFSFKISAAGEFYIDCGTGGNFNSTGNQVGYLNRNDTLQTTYTCTWANADSHVIKFGGAATGYNTNSNIAAITFNIVSGYTSSNTPKIAGISGSLGAIFGTVSNPSTGQSQPRFYQTFYNAWQMTGSIPSNLFSGISGAPASNMFENTFDGCNGLTGFTDGTNTTTYVPADFLADINTNTSVSEQVPRMFRYTQLDNSCPANTYDVTRQQFNDAGKPWCSPCPSGTHYTGTGATSVNQCCSEGYDWDGTQCSVLSVIDLTWIVDNQTYDTSTCTVNDLVTLPEEPTKDGYTFMGWTLQQEAPLE
jgi:hypothetical protein